MPGINLELMVKNYAFGVDKVVNRQDFQCLSKSLNDIFHKIGRFFIVHTNETLFGDKGNSTNNRTMFNNTILTNKKKFRLTTMDRL